ncbi:MAG: ABC transporter ATP-binding protein [Synergistaceae bacterium]|jgi:oligopeptide transport system ATP-binding protein|nr:ABC transporter ATP-binding protein [Synergistaceae bacterium]
MSDEQLLDVKNLRTSFLTSGGVVSAVRGISFSVGHGEFIGIVGESGCGKSVTMLSIMRLLAGNASVKADSLFFDGRDLLKLSSKEIRKIHGSDIGMIFQDPMTSLDPLYTIGDQIMEPLKIHKKMTRREARRKAAEMLDMVGISSPGQRLDQYPHEFSGGMRQRAMIAIAMCCDPKLLIADEPTTALDVTIQAQILELMMEMKKKFSTATALITHDLGVIASSCSRVVVMYGGLIMEIGLSEDIFYRPLHPYTNGLLNSITRAGGKERGKLIPIPGSPPDLMNPPVGCPFTARCEYAMRICAEARPSSTYVSENHSAACWLLHAKASGMRSGIARHGR